MSLLGVVLAGGESRRFGSDKALAMLDGRSLLDHAAAALAPFVDEVVVAGRAEGAGWRTVEDRPRPGLGPLGGLCGGLDFAARRSHAAILTIACDIPRVPAELVARLASGEAAYVAEAPVLACWPIALLPKLGAYLRESDDRSIVAWARHAGAVALEAGTIIPNVNRPGDLHALRRDI